MKPVIIPSLKGILILLIIFVTLPAFISAGVTDDDNSTPHTPIGPDYEIREVSLPKQVSWLEPGMIISPNIAIRNTGGDDTGPGTVQITASLGAYQLVSQNNFVTPLKGGEERYVTLDYLIPDGIPSREYALIITLDPEREQTGINTKNNEAKSPDSLTIRTIKPKVKVSSCGCS